MAVKVYKCFDDQLNNDYTTPGEPTKKEFLLY